MNFTPNRDKALMILQKEISVFVYDAVQLEGYNFTLPEIQTLLEGITVGGHKISDQQIAINQAEAWKLLIYWIKNNDFAITIPKLQQLHAIAGKEEALNWGNFRTGPVAIAGTDYLPPPAETLNECFDVMLTSLREKEDIWEKAISLFLQMARNQFFYDVNKRMGRFMMNGFLISHGYPPINLPASKKLEFNQLMLDYYPTGDEAGMQEFMKSCIKPIHLEIMAKG
ncbi:MAG: Fic family protein [Leptospira sp.]|nr:Fic family protein [Leptospira sp.]